MTTANVLIQRNHRIADQPESDANEGAGEHIDSALERTLPCYRRKVW